MTVPLRLFRISLVLLSFLSLSQSLQAQSCARTITAEVVAFDQVFFWNRLGAVQPQGMMFALRRDVVAITGATPGPGNVRLRPDKRPRPIVLRMNVGDCLRITFRNWLDANRRDDDQSNTRWASVHVVGLNWTTGEADDGSFVGENNNSLVNVGGTAVYTLHGEREGEHVLYSAGALAGGQGDGGHVNSGLFGAVLVEPQGSRWYRSQVTRQDMTYASTGTTPAPYNQPIINYEAVPIDVEPREPVAGEDVRVRLRLADPETRAPKTGLEDVRVLTFQSPGLWQQRQWANERGGGLYEITFRPREEGLYYIFVEVASAGLLMQGAPFLMLEIKPPASPLAAGPVSP